jgi:undecaprenyl-phosphate galactose phosphotransferase
MKRHRKKFFKKSLLILILILLDYSIINFSYLFSKTLFQIFIDKNNIYQINNFATITRNTISYLVLIIAFWARDLYKLKPWNIWEEVSRILYSSLMAGIVISFIYIDNGVPKDIFIWWITLMLFVGIDIVARFLLRCYLNKKNIYNIKAIILGSGFQGEEFCEYAIENPFSLYKIDGFVYENKEIVNNKKEEVLNKEIFKKADIKILGDIEHIIKYIVKHAIDEVVIAVPKVDRKGLSDIIHKLEGKVRYIKFIPDMYGLMTFSTEIHDYEQVLTIAASQGLLNPIKKIQKRIFDLICSIIGIIFLIPVFIIVYILIKLEDGGKVIFKQKRIGENGKEIYIYISLEL